MKSSKALPIGAATAMAVMVLAGAVPASLLHNHLVRSRPGAGEVLTASPKEVELWFAERPEIAFTSITLTDTTGKRFPTGKGVASSDTLALRFSVDGTLPLGSYDLVWRTASEDGHAVRGQYRFQISP